MAMIFAPIAAAFLAWFWVGGMNLLQDPASKLGGLMAVTVLLTAILAAAEAQAWNRQRH